MTAQAQAIASNGNGNAWKTLVYSAQFFFGGWFLFHGLNHWLQFFVQPSGSGQAMKDMIAVLIDSGLFDIIKAMEVIGGALFLANRFVPLGIIVSTPITLTIAYLNFTMGDSFGVVVGVISVILNGLVCIGYLEHFLPALRYDCGDPSLDGLKKLLRGELK